MKDLTFVLADDQRAVEVWDTLASAGINVVAGCAFPRESGRVIHVVVDAGDEPGAVSALAGAGFAALDDREVLVVPVEDRPGAIADVSRAIAEAGGTIYTMYLATNNRLVVGTADLDLARRALGA